MTKLLHITERMHWVAASHTGEYRVSTRDLTLEQQGFVHCSLPHQLRAVAEFIYGDADDLVVLVIDSAKLAVPVRSEAPEPGSPSYPHVYGPIPTEAVDEVITVTRDVAGRLVLPE